ncbi:MAG: Type 1 glutamine amidotransferase-like domain-containing protein [Chloroflexota bacterium]
MTNGRLLLAGGGNAQQSEPLDKLLASWVGENGRLLYIPIAMRRTGTSFPDCWAWITAVFEPLGCGNITMWTDLTAHQPEELDEFTAVYIGGGNTYSLLAELRASGFDVGLRDYVAQGGIVYGGSAGAIILGGDIAACAHMDSNNVGLADTAALNLVQNHDLWVHYQAADDDVRITDYIAERRVPILAIAEEAGVWVENGRFQPVGDAPVYRFDEMGRKVLL